MVEFDKPVMQSDLHKSVRKIISLGLIHFQEDTLPALVSQYVSLLETEPSRLTCKCTWRIHPEDMHISEDCCRHCGHALELFNSDSGKCEAFNCECTKNAGRRMVLIDEHERCPVHTKEGFLLGFFEWAVSSINDTKSG